MTKDEALRLALEVLKNNRRTHHYCEDTWYSCPKHEDGCANDSEGDECNCGADEANAEIDQAIIAGEAALEAKDEPVAYCKVRPLRGDEFFPKIEIDWVGFNWPMTGPLYATPPQRKPLTNGEIYTAYITATNQTLRATDERLAFAFARAIEAAHGIKENT